MADPSVAPAEAAASSPLDVAAAVVGLRFMILQRLKKMPTTRPAVIRLVGRRGSAEDDAEGAIPVSGHRPRQFAIKPEEDDAKPV